MKFSSALLSIAALAGVASATTYSNSTSATSSSASESSTATPYCIGYEQDGEPFFAVHVPTSLNFNGFNVLSLDDAFPFNPSANAINLISGSSSTPYTGFSDDSSPSEIDITFSGDYSSYSEAVFSCAGNINGVPGSYTGNFALTLNPTGLKRDEKVYYLSATVVILPSSSSPSSTLSDYTLPLSTIYSTVTAPGSTTVTVTCTKESCSGVETVVTGVTTVTHGITVYTTYCPLTTTETYIPVYVVSTVYKTVDCTASATTVTVPCTKAVCTAGEVGTVTTGVITVTKGTTIYTTYCPVSSTYQTVETHHTTVSHPTYGSTVVSIPVTVASHASTVVSSAVYVKVGTTTTPVPVIATTLASTTSHPAAAPSVSILTGAAGKQAASAGLLGAGFIAAFFY